MNERRGAARRWVVRPAEATDTAALCRFGAAHVAAHYAPLIGAAAADAQVATWWNATHLGAAVADRLVVVADDGTELIGVGQRGTWDGDPVIWKLYVHPGHRGTGVGPTLLDALVEQLPAGTEQVFIEHFAANVRAGAFYERQGFPVDRIEPSPSGDPALDVVWRVRRPAHRSRTVPDQA